MAIAVMASVMVVVIMKAAPTMAAAKQLSPELRGHDELSCVGLS